jgi:hypothetical protein
MVPPAHRCLPECCEACRRYRSSGLCDGAPGVGKSRAARHDAHGEPIAAGIAARDARTTALTALLARDTIV